MRNRCVAQLTSGSTGDLMNQLSYSTMGGGGAYSPYVGAIVDTAKILASLHTAHFQYIPALALPTKDTLNLRLNMPPSFRDPKSVVVVALPPVSSTKGKLPPLHPVNPSEYFCAQKPGLVLPAEGAPLVFATQLAHELDSAHHAAPGIKDPCGGFACDCRSGPGRIGPRSPSSRAVGGQFDRRACAASGALTTGRGRTSTCMRLSPASGPWWPATSLPW